MNDFDRQIDRTATSSLKWERYGGRDVLPLWVADMDFPAPPAVVAALQQRVAHRVYGYTLPPSSLPDAVRDFLARRHQWEVPASWIVWLPGVVSGLHACCRAFARPGDEVMTHTPAYAPFLDLGEGWGCRTLRVPLRQQTGTWQLPFDAMRSALGDRTRLLFLCNPHNPTGRVFSRSELEEIADFCIAGDLTLVSDEIHCDLIMDETKAHLPVASLSPEIAARTVTLMAPSKTFNIPGLGCAFAIIPDRERRAAFTKAVHGIVPPVNLLGFAAAEAAYREGEPWLRQLLGYLRGNLDLVREAVARWPGLRFIAPEATYLAWLDARGLPHDPSPAARFETAGVGLNDGAIFGAPGWVRLNFGCPRPLLREALTRMQAAIADTAPR